MCRQVGAIFHRNQDDPEVRLLGERHGVVIALMPGRLSMKLLDLGVQVERQHWPDKMLGWTLPRPGRLAHRMGSPMECISHRSLPYVTIQFDGHGRGSIRACAASPVLFEGD